MSKVLCDDYFVYKNIRNKGVKVSFITGRTSGARANNIILPMFEEEDNIPINRIFRNGREMFLFPRNKLKKVFQIVDDLKPDIIHCQGTDCMRLALLIRQYFGIPIVLHIEIASKILTQKFIGSWKMRSVYLAIGLPTQGTAFWSWLCKRADAIITSHPPDQKILPLLSNNNKPVYYLPWPAEIPDNCNLSSTKDVGRGIYAGLLVPFKNTQQFKWILPKIIEQTPTREFIIIGTGADVSIIKDLQSKYGNSIKYIPKMPRCEVIKLISNSYYAFTPVKEGGWGFIGDCWSVRTPLLMLTNVYQSEVLSPAVAENSEGLIQKINQLYNDQMFYRRMQEIGDVEYSKRTAVAVSEKLFSILSTTIEKHKSLY